MTLRRIYLDTCSLQRPLDTKTQLRIQLEAEAVLALITLCEEERLRLVSSEVLLFETERNPDATRRTYAFEVLSKAEVCVGTTDKVVDRARALNRAGIPPLDALHLASSEAEADYFCTCDDKLLRRAKALKGLKIKVVSPLELIEEIAR